MKRALGSSNVSKQDLAEVLGTSKKEGEPEPSKFDTADRIKGLGFKGLVMFLPATWLFAIASCVDCSSALVTESSKQERALGLRTFDVIHDLARHS